MKEYFRITESNPLNFDTAEMLLNTYRAIHERTYEVDGTFYRKFLLHTDAETISILILTYNHLSANRLTDTEIFTFKEKGYIR